MNLGDLKAEYQHYLTFEGNTASYEEWLEDAVYSARQEAANAEKHRTKAENEYKQLCHAVVGAQCHVDHAIETLNEQHEERNRFYEVLKKITRTQRYIWNTKRECYQEQFYVVQEMATEALKGGE